MAREFTLQDVHEHLDLVEALGIWVLIGGGWGVDALLGEQTRAHRDLDILVQWDDLKTLRDALEGQGYADIRTDDESAWNFVVQDQDGRRIDFHVIEFAEDGSGLYGPRGQADWAFPAESLTARGVIGGREVSCHPPASQVDFHIGYAFGDDDRADVAALCERFDLPLPDEYRQ